MMPARFEESSRHPGESTGIVSPSCDVAGDGSDGNDCWATLRKKSSMYCSEAGSYCKSRSVSCRFFLRRRPWVPWVPLACTHIDLHGVVVGEAIHVPLGEKSVGEERQEHEFGKLQ
ncbi:hypothetical protein G6O67_006079 [Ophiocordyceps sinensis]|uniref:Uncharacterized protein n=1 Tax=Ophiocordyceps sinensis TaxID=72228 RepID=A0A8H4LXL4_9HYPO|nr:hypothetical protein G6O67_006079 [Ophiocordyceps sinensis]